MRLFLVTMFLLNSFLLHADNYLIVDRINLIVERGGDIYQEMSPCSTFKIPLALLGFREGILVDAKNPKMNYADGFVNWHPKWEKACDPKTWLQESCVWYSQEVITKPLGQEKLQQFVNELNYGNKDVSGKYNEDYNFSWLNSSLKISPYNQVNFLIKLLSFCYFGFANDKTISIMPSEKLENNWNLYGKTGTSYFRKEDGSDDKTKQMGWYIGWIQKWGMRYIFAYAIEEMETNPELSGGQMAKKRILEILRQKNYLD
jgi:beta-lactamase class D